jgi:hypothetical protein
MPNRSRPPPSRLQPVAAACKLGVEWILGSHCRAQVANVAGLLALAPDMQERIVLGDAVPTTNYLRRIAGVPLWSDQRALLPDGGCNS